MYVLTNAANIAVYFTSTAEIVENGVLVDGGAAVFGEQGIRMNEIEMRPDGVKTWSHCYTAEKGFYTNPDYVEPKTSIDELIAENTLLKAQIQAATERTDFIEDCIAEMAAQVYNT